MPRGSAAPVTLDPRLHAWRADLADSRLRDRVAAPRYADGREARTVVGRAPLRRLPQPQAETVSFSHYGEALSVFEEAGGYAWCQSRFDGYVGYVAAEHIAIGQAPAATHYVATLGAYAHEGPDLRSAARDFLPRHSVVTVAAAGLVTRGTEYVRLDSGLHLPRACLSQAPPRSPDIAAAAMLYLGCPYLWGGRSFLGLDCSGLVQCAFQDLGVAVPRDTDLQERAIGDSVVAGAVGDLRRGDLLYLPGHVLIYAGDGAMIHADGASMMVRCDKFAALMRERALQFASFVVRRA